MTELKKKFGWSKTRGYFFHPRESISRLNNPIESDVKEEWKQERNAKKTCQKCAKKKVGTHVVDMAEDMKILAWRKRLTWKV